MHKEDIDTSRMAVITTVTGEKFLGELPEGVDELQMQELVVGLKPMMLKNARQLVGQLNPQTDNRGNIISIRTFMALLPYDLFEGPADSLFVIPTAWYFIKGGKIKERALELLRTAERNEMVNKATEAGISVAGPMPNVVPK